LKTKSFSVEKFFASDWPFFNRLKIRELENRHFSQFLAPGRAKIRFNRIYALKVPKS
jgi:hypothetical protein